MAVNLSGRCLCGAVQFSFEPAEPEIDACHCTMCRRWGGGPALAIKAKGAPIITGADNVTAYKSSEWAERQFCKNCGTHLFYSSPSFSYFGVSAGTVDDQSGLSMTTEIFIDRKPDYYDFANATKRLTEAEFIEMVSGGTGKE
ncbi:MAG: GFA family protein [Hyphomicrobium sp.]